MRGTGFAEIEAFVAIAERKSFAKAALHLGVSRSILSQNLRSLEERLGVRLLNRTTRSVLPTEAGERMLLRARPALQELVDTLGEAGRSGATPSGLLRLVVQPPVANLLIAPILPDFIARYPGIQLDISVEKMPSDIVKGAFDAGIRIGEQIERDMVTMRVIGEAKFVAVASPAYLARWAPPKTPKDLKNHDCIRARLPNGAIFGWEFQRNAQATQVAVRGTLTVDDIGLAIAAALKGVGIAYVLFDFVAAQVEKGELVPVLESWSPRLSGFYLYYSNRRQITPPLRCFIDFLKAETKRRGLRSYEAPRTNLAAKHRLVRTARG